ncbi:MAG: hypothetical protein EOP11_23100 [Proteobacteria bacterium]|nr:MAG: hypothetical protein EOP11_23100 [Pseudomonadota bacterium]
MTETAQVRKVSSKRSRGSQGAAGQLDRYDDGTWEFFGNGTTTTADVAENIINYERRENNPDYERIKADTLAQLLLDSADNKALKRLVNGDVRKPIPKSQAFLAEGRPF